MVFRRSGYKLLIVIIIFTMFVLIIGIGFKLYKGNQIRVRVSKVNVAKEQEYVDVDVVIKSKKYKEYYGNQLRVKKLFVQRGDYVEKGQTLLSFDNNDILSQYAQAQIQLENIILQKNQMISNSENFKRQKNSLQDEINTLKEAQEDKEGIISELDDVYEYANKGLSSNLYQEEFEGEIDKLFKENEDFKKFLLELEMHRDSIPQISDEQIKLLDNYIMLAENNLKNIEEKLSMYEDVKAEFNGVVTNININEGSYTQPGSTIIIIQDLQNIKGITNISKENISKVKIGQEVIINDSIGMYNGKVSEMGELISSIQPKDNSVIAEIEVTNPDEKLKVDFNLKGKILLDSQINILKIPKSCVLSDEQGGSYVYVVKEGIAYKIYIVTGKVANGYVEILGGIDSSENVILNPDERINNKSKVKIIKS